MGPGKVFCPLRSAKETRGGGGPEKSGKGRAGGAFSQDRVQFRPWTERGRRRKGGRRREKEWRGSIEAVCGCMTVKKKKA